MASTKGNERLLTSLYAMQRANGDVFALDDHGRFRVPVFHSSHDANTARLRNFGMMLFKPVPLDARLLKEIIPLGGAAEVEFWLVDDSLINLNRGRLITPRQLALLARNGIKLKAAPRAPTTDAIASSTASAFNKTNATAAWEDEGGLHSKCA